MTNNRIIAGALVLVLLLVTAAPRPAYAAGGFEDTVHDIITEIETGATAASASVQTTLSTALNVKELSLDPIAWAVAKMAIQTMTKSVVQWINSGFNGSPAFVTNMETYLMQVSDVAANQFIGKLTTNPAIKSPFQSQVAATTQQNYLKSTNPNGFFLSNPYTLNQYTTDDAGFIAGKNFNGGWQAWLAMTTQPQNNPLGAQQLAQSALQQQTATAQANSLTKLGWGQGFLSWCGGATGGGGGASSGGACKTDDDCGGALACISGKCSVDASLDNPANTCTNKDGSTGTITTPGSVIQAQLNKTLGLSGDQLVTADEFNEIIGALMSQLVGQVIGSTGLLGVSQPSSSGSSLLDQATSASQLTGTSGSISTAFTQGIASAQDQVKQYQASWATIGTAAASAISAGGGSCPDTTTTPAAAKTQADAAATKSASALSTLQKISTDAAAAAQSGTVATGQPGSAAGAASLQDAATEYQTFMASSNMPSATDIQYARQQSQDTGTSTPATLYSQMEHIASGCLAL